MTKLTKKQIEDAVIGAVDEIDGKAIDHTDMHKRLDEDFGMDSIDKVDFVMKLENELGIDIPDSDAQLFTTLQSTISYLEHRFM